VSATDAPAHVLESAPALLGRSEAVFSPDHIYRYRLTRAWGTSGTHATWIMLNPSTADHRADDPTIRRCTKFTKAWGLDGLVVVNLFALRSADPRALLRHPAPVGADNDYFIRAAIHPWSVVVAAWGAHKITADRAAAVLEIIDQAGSGVGCLGTTKDGYPRHPLYLPDTTELEEYQP
jgi:hypothetical protein